MALNNNVANCTKIKLYYYDAEQAKYRAKDISDICVGGIGARSMVGFTVDTENSHETAAIAYYDVVDIIMHNIEKVLDAVVVNEKQKTATISLIRTAVYEPFAQNNESLHRIANDIEKCDCSEKPVSVEYCSR